eukprot:12637152-Alexandrium_andersonii.AAC.1
MAWPTSSRCRMVPALAETGAVPPQRAAETPPSSGVEVAMATGEPDVRDSATSHPECQMDRSSHSAASSRSDAIRCPPP